MIELVLEVPPPINSMWAGTKRGIFIKTKEYKDYIKYVQCICQTYALKPTECDVTVSMKWYRKRRQGDVDGRIKPILDGMSGFVYHDDKQVQKVSIERDDTDKKNPRVEVVIQLNDLTLPHIG